MNEAEVAELFIKAAFIDSRLPDNARPKTLKGSWVPFFHSTEDIRDRRVTGIRHGKEKEHLHPGDDPLNEWRYQFWEMLENGISRNDVTLWEHANELMALASDTDNRRALWAWAKAKAGQLEAKTTKNRKPKKLGQLKLFKRVQKNASFAAWCRSEGIHEITGSRRKDRAIAIISQHLVRGTSSNVITGDYGVLPVGPVFEHIADIIAVDAPNENGETGRTFIRDRDTVSAKRDTVNVWDAYRAQRRRMVRKARQAETA